MQAQGVPEAAPAARQQRNGCAMFCLRSFAPALQCLSETGVRRQILRSEVIYGRQLVQEPA